MNQSMKQLLARLDEAIEERVSPLRVGLDRVLEIANTTDRSWSNLLRLLGKPTISEDAAKGIQVKIKERRDSHNLYEVLIPSRGVASGKPGKAIMTYAVKENTHLEGEDDEKATARIMDELRKEVQAKITAYHKAKNEGDIEGAKKAFYGAEEPQLFQTADSAQEHFNKVSKPKFRPTKMSPFVKKASASRDKMLKKEGLLTRHEMAGALGIKNAGDIIQFASNGIQALCKAYPQWDELRSVESPTLNEIDAQLASAKTNEGLIRFLADNFKIDENKLSEDAAEALAAASIILSASIAAADAKL